MSPERIKRLKQATVQITIEGTQISGTGFFINDQGYLATCWHVIDTATKPTSHVRIIIHFNDGDTAEYSIGGIRTTEDRLSEQVNDNCILVPTRPLHRVITPLKIGNFNHAEEGDQVSTCGYPLGYSQQFVSTGMISTKYQNDNVWRVYGQLKSFPRKEALLDLTLNRGNSGGAIVKMGKTIDEDSVIAIADFGLTPLGQTADSLINALAHMKSWIVVTGGPGERDDPAEISMILARGFQNVSLGVSGCISVNYLRDALLATVRQARY
jgi:serine protease Do